MSFNRLAFSAIYAVIIANIVLFAHCERIHVDPATMNIVNDASLLGRFAVLSRGDYLYTSEMRDILQDSIHIFNISEACTSDIKQVTDDIASSPPKLYAVQSKYYYVIHK